MMILRNTFSTSTFSNYIASCLLMLTISICSIGLVHASEKTQSFSSDWTVSPWDYYGDTAAMEWHYIEYEPWDTVLGKLREVRVQTEILGEHESRAEDVRIRYAFFTGWSPADYQLSTHSYKPVSDKVFSILSSVIPIFENANNKIEEIIIRLNNFITPPLCLWESYNDFVGKSNELSTLYFIKFLVMR